MILTSHTIATKFDTVVKALSEKVDLEIKTSNENLINVLKKLDEQFGKVATVINNQAKQINGLQQRCSYHGNRYVKTFICWNQLLVLMFGQFSNRVSEVFEKYPIFVSKLSGTLK